jgi:hypothetical protein
MATGAFINATRITPNHKRGLVGELNGKHRKASIGTQV